MKRLPATGYRYLALLAIRHHGRLTKGRLARDIRANHTMVTKTLAALVADGLATINEAPNGTYEITPTGTLAAYLDTHGGSLDALHHDELRTHYAYGRPPPWTGGKTWSPP